MADISNIVTVSLVPPAGLAAPASVNRCAIMTTRNPSSGAAWTSHRTLSSVATEFGAGSREYAAARTFFATQPNPTGSGESLYFIRRVSSPITVAALGGSATGAPPDVNTLQGISDGSLRIGYNSSGAAETADLTGLDFTLVTTAAQAAAVIAGDPSFPSALAAAATPDGRIRISHSTAGAGNDVTSLGDVIDSATQAVTGTAVGALLGFGDGSVESVPGAAEATLAVQTEVEAAQAGRDAVSYTALASVDAISDRAALAAWAQTSQVMVYEAFDGSDGAILLANAANPAFAAARAGRENFRCLYRGGPDRDIAYAYMARLHTSSFSAEGTALTMQLKTLPIEPDSLTQAQVESAAVIGLDVYTTVAGQPAVVTSGRNNWADMVYNLLAFRDAVQKEGFNLLRATGSKIPQTEGGVQQIVAALEGVARRFRASGVFAPGSWTGPDRFGNPDTFNRAIARDGYYFLSRPLSSQTAEERQSRRSPPIQGAVKMAGAFHSLEVILQIDE